MKEKQLQLHLVPNGRGGLVRVWQPKGSRFRPEKVVSVMPDFDIYEIVHLDDPVPPTAADVIADQLFAGQPDFGLSTLPARPISLPPWGSFATVEVKSEPPPLDLKPEQRSRMTIEERRRK